MSQSPRAPTAAAWRFLVVGGTNTAVTAGILVGLSYLLPGWVAYTIAFGLGLVFATVFASRWVFTRGGRLGQAMRYAFCYLAIFLMGLGCVAVVRSLEWPQYLNALSILVTAPLGFIAGRLVFRGRQNGEEPND